MKDKSRSENFRPAFICVIQWRRDVIRNRLTVSIETGLLNIKQLPLRQKHFNGCEVLPVFG